MTLTLLPVTPLARDSRGALLTVRVVRAEAARTVVAMRGEADWSTTAILSDALSRVIASHVGDVAIELGELDFIDTATVRVIATAHHLLAGQERALTVRSPSRLARRVLEVFALTNAIEAVEDNAC